MAVSALTPFVRYHPLKALYAVIVTIFEAAKFPIWVAFYISASGRPHKSWTLRQAIGMHIVKSFLYHASVIEIYTPLSLRSGWERKRFAVIEPAKTSLYVGPTDDKKIRPQKIGATWYPKPLLQSDNVKEERVLLHFHGGAFVIGDGREADAGYACRTIVKHCGLTRAFAPQYRLASNRDGEFPAALQDAITSYNYLINVRKIPASRIILSGDSAGGCLVLTLLRYIAEFGWVTDMPEPGAALLWSPWVNLKDAQNPAKIYESANYQTDYLNAGFGSWGANTYAKGKDAEDPWISPLFKAFSTPVPIFVQTGDAEVLYHDDLELVDKFEKVKGNKVELHVQPHAPHDIALIGNLLGFEKEFGQCADKAADFLRKYKKI